MGTTFASDLGSLTRTSDSLYPISHLSVATSALARLPPADAQLWTDSSVTPNAGLAVYVNGALYATAAHTAGLKASDFRAEAVAMCQSLAIITTLQSRAFISTPVSGSSC